MLPLIEVPRLLVAPAAEDAVEAGRLPTLALVAAALGLLLLLVLVLPHPVVFPAEEVVLLPLQPMLGLLLAAPALGLRPAAAARGPLRAPLSFAASLSL